MKNVYSWAEIIIDRLVPFAVIGLLGIIIIDFFFQDFKASYELYINIIDYIIVIIFVLDLLFKYLRIKNIKNFLKTCWLDIIAIFPFFLLFRVFESLLLITELPKEITSFQLVFHEGIAFSKETAKIVKEAEEVGKISRVKLIIGMFERVEKTPRIVKALPFYEQPIGKHHLTKIPGKKEYKLAKKIYAKIEKESNKEIGKTIDAGKKIEKKIIRKIKKK
jgi:hypothetical protein